MDDDLAPPPVMVALLTAITGLGAMLLVAFPVALLTPDLDDDTFSILGIVGSGAGPWKEILRDTVGMTQARIRFGDETGTVLAGAFVLVPVLAMLFTARVQAHRTAGLAPAARLAWSTFAAVPFVTACVLIALLCGGDVPESFDEAGGEVGFAFGSVVLYGLLWPVVAAAAGTAWAIRAEGGRVLPGAIGRWTAVVTVPLRALAGWFAVAAVLGAIVWETQTLRGQESALVARDGPTAFVENATFAGELGVWFTGLGVYGRFEPPNEDTNALGLLAIPTDDAGGPDEARALLRDFDDEYRVFAFGDALPAYTFLPLLLLILGLPLVFALYSGYRIAHAIGIRNPLATVGLGAVTGLVWAIGLVLVRAIMDAGLVTGGSLFTGALLVGMVGGAIGGGLASAGLIEGQPDPEDQEPEPEFLPPTEPFPDFRRPAAPPKRLWSDE